jgi:hypothetical protein
MNINIEETNYLFYAKIRNLPTSLNQLNIYHLIFTNK